MSLFGALSTAISGLNAQSAAFGNISDNVANSQTTGFKRVDTSFVDYLTTSTAKENEPGAVVAQPSYVNNVQGTVTQTDNPLGMAITGQGFFAVSQATSVTNGVPTFNEQAFYTRAGDFSLDANGYILNSAGQYLNGWAMNATTSLVDMNALAPIHVTQTSYNPVKTSNVVLSANLPAAPKIDPSTGTAAPISSQISVYDALGTAHTVTLNWTQTVKSDWTLQINALDDIVDEDRGTAQIQFGALSTNPVAEGTIGEIAAVSGSIVTTGYLPDQAATLIFDADFGSGTQTITLNLGTYGQTNGVTQYDGDEYSLHGLTQDGVPPGSFSGITTDASGDVVVNYNNGQSRTIAQIPLITFNNPNALQRQNGQCFTATRDSGQALANPANTNGTGSIVTGSIEGSNVDIATEFSHLIVAQQAYSANAKVVTTSDQMLQITINMKT
jgi:flagellar hook protein FlgE